MLQEPPRASAAPPPGFTCKLRTRGTHQLEIKLHYPLRVQRKQIFETFVYVFAPDKLDLTGEGYGVQRVLDEVVLHLRHASPRIPLEDLVRPEIQASPLTRLAVLGTRGKDPAESARIIRELKTLVNAYRGEAGAAAAVARRSATGNPPDRATLRRQVELVAALPAAYRELRRTLEGLGPVADVAQAIAWTDEALSVVEERALFKMLDAMEGRRALRAEAALLRGALAAESAYRVQAGLPLVPSAEATSADQQHNERVLLRIRALKRWSQSALYLGQRFRKDSARVGQVVAGGAAALAMTVAVVAAAFAERHFATYSLPWAFIIVFAYILKDRIKEAARGVLAALIPRWASDRAHRLVDATGKSAGLTRETVRFPSPGHLPDEVRVARRQALAPEPALPGDGVTPESVMQLRVWMRTRSSVLLRDHRRLKRLTGIVRWGVDGWLQGMDAPQVALRTSVGEEERRVTARRIYHVHVAVRMGEEGSPEALDLHLYRVALSRDGIVRTERLPLDGCARSPDPPADTPLPSSAAHVQRRARRHGGAR